MNDEDLHKSIQIGDKYNTNEQTNNSSDRYFSSEPKHNPSYLPIDGDDLEQYVRRLGITVRQLSETSTSAHIYGRKVWHTHSSAGDCWICNLRDMLNLEYDILLSITQLSPKTYGFHSNSNGTTTLSKLKPKAC